jgi:hypothetical protein
LTVGASTAFAVNPQRSSTEWYVPSTMSANSALTIASRSLVLPRAMAMP